MPEIKELLIQAGQLLRSEFKELLACNPHYGERGGEAEQIVRSFLNGHLPKRFEAGSGFVVDDENGVSRQSDILIYDALNSFRYRSGPTSLILPSDNVAAVIEVKSRLNKAQLADASEKVASVKRLRKSPISNLDQPVLAKAEVAMTSTLGIVFAFESETKLGTLAENLAEINSAQSPADWIDLVVVLDKGTIGYGIQLPFSQGLQGDFGGSMSGDFAIPPYFVHLICDENGQLALNRFLIRLMAHLNLFRKRSTLTTSSVLGSDPRTALSVRMYRYNLERKLIAILPEAPLLEKPIRSYEFLAEAGRVRLGKIDYVPWLDAAIVVYSGQLPLPIILQMFSGVLLDTSFAFMHGSPNEEVWVSSIVSMTSQQFDMAANSIHGIIVQLIPLE